MKEFIKGLFRQGIHITCEDGNLKISHNGNLTDEIKQSIRDNKEAIIAFFEEENTRENYTSIDAISVEESYPLSSAQYRLWVLSQFEGGLEAYNLPVTEQLIIEDLPAFKRAIHAVIDRHEILRTVFKPNEKGEIRQWIKPQEDIGFELIHHNYQGLENTDELVATYITEDNAKPFDLENGPLLRMSLLQRTETYYIFQYNMHHIISDGWSIEVLTKDLMHYYEAFKNNTEASLSNLKIQYKDYAAWQLGQLNTDKNQASKNYWLEKFSGELPLIDLPTSKQRPKVKTYNGGTLTTYFDSELTNIIKEYNQANGGSLFMSLLSTLSVLLHKYTSENDIIIGSPVSGRDHIDLKDQIGFYVNALAFRNEIRATESFTDFYKRVKENTLTSYDHQMYPFDKLVEDLNLNKDTSRSAIFDIMLTLQNNGENKESSALSDAELNTIKTAENTASKFDLELSFEEQSNCIFFNLAYNKDVYEASMLQRFMVHYKQLLKALLTQPNVTIAEVDYLSAEEKKEVIEDFNIIGIPFPTNKTIVDIFAEAVEKNPNGIAVAFEGTSFTYAEIDKTSNELANCLITKHNVALGDFVSLALNRSEWLIISILGILKAGGTYVPIDPDSPADRIAYIKEDSNSKIHINQEFINKFKTENFTAEKTSVAINPNDLAYVIYTSGSTGKPKGVMIPHINVVRLFFNDAPLFDFNSQDAWCLFHSYAFDFSVWEIFGALLHGGKLVIPTKQDVKDPELLAKLLVEEKITVLNQTPSSFQSIHEKLQNSGLAFSLRYIIFGGEALYPHYLEKWTTIYPACKLINMYGITETTVHATYKEITAEDIQQNISNVGKPIPTLQCYILDKNGNPLPIGITGEIHVSGTGLATGYLNRPTLTAERFIESPYRKGEKLYKTGDLGRWLSDGTIEYIGRRDSQVKIRGYRIELGEIEYTLSKIEAVKSAVVLALNLDAGYKEIVAYFTSEKDLDSTHLREQLNKNLPAYMLPSYFVQLETFPLTSNGKIASKKLPNPKELSLKTEIEYSAPESQKEKALITVCEAVLGRKNISMSDNFFNLGGESIKSIQIVSRLSQAGFTLKVDDIMRTPVLKSLATLIKDKTREIDQSPVEGEVLLTPVQEWMFANENIKIESHYNQSILIKSKNALNNTLLEKCLQQLVNHHDALRMTFAENTGNITQFNQKAGVKSYSLDVYDLRQNGALEAQISEMTAIANELQSSINLENGPLVRVGNFRLQDGDYIALIIHHLIIDGISWRILLEDLSTLYNLAENGKTLVLPSKTDSYQEWSKALTNHALNGISSKEQNYWKGLTATEIPALPTDHENTSNEKTSAEVTFQLNKEFTNLLQTKAHSVFNTEINDILLTSLGLAIKDILKVDRTVINMEGHGREEFIDGIDITRTIGWFTSLFPFILDVTDSSDLKNLIKVKESLRNIPNKGIGYGMLKYLKKENFKHELTPKIEFNYLGDFGNELSSESNEVPQFQYVSDSIGNNISKENTDDITLNISGIMVNNQLELNLFYYKEDYDQETVEKLWNAYKYHLENIIGELSETDEQLLTPSDMTFSLLPIDTLLEVNHDNSIEDIYKLSPLQRGIFFMWLSNKDPRLFFNQVAYRFEGTSIIADNFKRAFEMLIERHAILRTSFTDSIDDELLQIVHKNVPSNFSYQKLPSNLTETEKLTFVETFKENDMDKGFDLAKPCQMRLSILELEDKKYEFIWSHHHILMDGWCIRIMIEEFAQILQSIENNAQPNLPTAQPYASYIKWLDMLDEEKSINYWNQYLSGLSQKTELPYKKADFNEDKEFEKWSKDILVDNELFTQMKALCLNIGVSHNIFIQAVWGYLLSNYNNSQDVVFGTVVSGRPAHINGIENMVGLFINTIPVRVQYAENDSPRQLIEKLQKNFLDNQEHHYTGLSEIQSQTILDTDLIKHTLTFENYPKESAAVESDSETNKDAGFGIQSVESREQMNFQFGIFVYPANNAIHVEFEYNKHNFETDLIENLAAQFKTVVSEFLANADKPLSSIQITPENEQHELLTKNNNTSVEFTQDSVVDLFKVQVATNSEMVAIATETKKYTYSELDALSNQYANFLRSEHNIETNDYVGIQLERSEWLVISILAILKIGGTYIPIDPQYPQERINYIVEDSHCKLLIDTTTLEAFQNGNFPSTLEETTITPETTAYALYTSGSTGKPKGVLISHASLTNYLTWGKSYYLNEEHKKDFGLFTSLSFDLTVTSLFLPLLNGGKLHIYKAKAEITDILQHYFESDLNCIKLTPAHISVLDNLTIKNSNIETAIVGGDKLEQKHIDTLKRINPSMRIYNEYGPTEATVGCVVSDVSEVTNGEILIGKPIANTEIYILNELGNIQPKGIKGELYIGGKGLAKGYLNKEELTTEKFIENPYKTGERLYKTGDVGSWTLDGNIEFFGRKDDQVKIRGYRIELGEIENSLKSLETIDEAVVLINKKEDGEHRIVAYYTSKEDISTTELTAHLQSKIPTYMLPSSYKKLEAMPLTINGKVDKKALLALQSDSQETATAYIAPRNEIEEKLVEIWADILKIDAAEISADANFMDLGGHSLKVIRVIARIQKEYGIKINIQTYFDAPILATIAEDIATVVWNNSEEAEEELESFSI